MFTCHDFIYHLVADDPIPASQPVTSPEFRHTGYIFYWISPQHIRRTKGNTKRTHFLFFFSFGLLLSVSLTINLIVTIYAGSTEAHLLSPIFVSTCVFMLSSSFSHEGEVWLFTALAHISVVRSDCSARHFISQLHLQLSGAMTVRSHTWYEGKW